MKDPDDKDEAATCLREAHEEIGLDPGKVEVLARLVPTVNRRQILITPVVGLADENFEPVVNPDEVEAAFILPLERFLSSQDHTNFTYENQGKLWISAVFQDYVGDALFRTWGLTASMCVRLAIGLFEREPDFEWHETETFTVQNPYIAAKEYIQLYMKGKEKLRNSKL